MEVSAPERSVAEPESGQIAGVRLFTRAPVTLSWLSAAVIPAARAAGSRGSGAAYLRRGWLHGPHVDILARSAGDQGGGWHDLAERLDAGPLSPQSALTEEAYLAQAREFGRLEVVPPPYLPMRAHGMVEFISPADTGSREPRLDQLRQTACSVLATPLMNMIDELSEQPGMATLRLAEAFMALADTHLLGPAYGVFSLRSHLEAFLSWAAPGKDVRPAFAARLATQSATVRAAVEQRIAGEPGRAAGAWRTAFAYCSGALDGAVAGGTLTLDLLDSVTDGIDRTNMGPPAAPAAVVQGNSPDSAFHRAVEASGVVADPLKWFASYRLLINLFYEQLPLLTVSPLQRYYMCYAIAETVDEVLGESWQDRLGREQARRAGESL